MPSVGLETTIAAFEQVKAIHALHHVTTVIGWETNTEQQINSQFGLF
jgi:hypothetical protein